MKNVPPLWQSAFAQKAKKKTKAKKDEECGHAASSLQREQLDGASLYIWVCFWIRYIIYVLSIPNHNR